MAGGVMAWTHSDTRYDNATVLDGTLKPAEVIEALQALHFQNDEHRVAVKLTRDVRDYFVRALRRRDGGN
jgi:hypothetical protein